MRVLPKIDKIKIFLLSFLILTLLLLPDATVKAQQASDATPNIGQSWNCLNVKAYKKQLHQVHVYANPEATFSPDSPAYMVECFSKPTGVNTCSTGDNSADKKLGLGGPLPNWNITIHPNQPVQLTAEGKLAEDPTLWSSKGPGTATVHTFFLVQEIPQVDQLTGSTGRAPSLQLGTWAPNIQNYNSTSNCVSLNWDPTGIVFDAKSLEPIDNVKVTLQKPDGSMFYDPTVTNPDTSEENGRYSFYVPTGNYALMAKKTSFTFPSVTDPLPYQTDPTFPYINIYRGGTFFEEENELVVNNIPMDPPISSPYRRDAKIISWSSQLLNTVNKYKFSGFALHPNSIIKIINKGNIVGQTTANAFGQFEILVDSQNINNAAVINIQAEKPAIMQQTTGLNLNPFRFSFVAFAQTETDKNSVEPILNFIAGFALDPNTTTAVPDAVITIYVSVSKKPFFTTNADTSGYFKIPSQFLPTFPYYLDIQNPKTSQSFTLTTSQFVSLNDGYPQKKGAVEYGKYQPEPTLPTNTTADKSQTPGTGQPPVGENQLPPTTKSASPTQLLGFGLILLLTIGLVTLGFFLWYKKRGENKQISDNQTFTQPEQPTNS